MKLTLTQHATHRAQQRGVPRLIATWLLEYGEERFDGKGGIIRFFNRKSLRRMERDMGSIPVRRFSEYLRCYLVESSDSGAVITIGKRHPDKRFCRI